MSGTEKGTYFRELLTSAHMHRIWGFAGLAFWGFWVFWFMGLKLGVIRGEGP